MVDQTPIKSLVSTSQYRKYSIPNKGFPRTLFLDRYIQTERPGTNRCILPRAVTTIPGSHRFLGLAPSFSSVYNSWATTGRRGHGNILIPHLSPLDGVSAPVSIAECANTTPVAELPDPRGGGCCFVCAVPIRESQQPVNPPASPVPRSLSPAVPWRSNAPKPRTASSRAPSEKNNPTPRDPIVL